MANRSATGHAFDAYADVLQSTRTGALGSQEGITAEDTRAAFQSGERQSRDLASKFGAIAESYKTAQQSTEQLRSDLADIAARGNSEITQIQNSSEPVAAKIGRIVKVVVSSQSESNAKAATHSATVSSAIQAVLNRQGIDTSAHNFAESNGVYVDGEFGSPNEDVVQRQVTKMLDEHPPIGPRPGSSSLYGNAEARPAADPSPMNPTALQNTSRSVYAEAESQPAGTQGSIPHVSASDAALYARAEGPSAAPPVPTTSPQAGLPTPAVPSGSGVGTVSQPATGVGTGQPGIPALHTAPTHALSPEGFAQNFNAGSQTGTPMSAGTEALSSSAAHAMQPQAPLHTESMAPPPMAPTTPTAAPIFETAHAAPTYDAAQAPVAPQPEAPQAYVAAPSAQAAPIMPSTAAPAAPQGPLPAYGADLRPPAATAPASPPAMPTAASPASAPVHPSTGAQLNQPAVVRQAPTTAATAATTPAGLTENAFAATTTGAMAGASAVQTQAQQRLTRLLDAVARQEPKLRWAIGDRDDGDTVLATDLASGWIPPHIEIPTGIKLLKPGSRSKSLDALLGETILTAAYMPGQYLPPAEDVDPTQMSIRARDTQQVEDLGWELSQATKWRDGLPRLAHTLAKAASTGTGYLDSEVDLLRDHLATVAAQVMGDYPDHVDAAIVGNWQLLATIDALIKGEKTAANYHFAWFQALNLALKGEVHR